MIRTLVVAASLSVCAACSPSETPSVDTSETAVVLSYTDAFVMEPIGGRDLTMGGVSISVEGGDVSLLSAESEAFGAMELHTMAMVDDRMQMRKVDRFDIPDGETLELKRGGDHLMMFDVSEDIVSGESVDITLTFDASGTEQKLVIEADVRAVGE